MANIYKSKYTGEQIEDILDKADGISVQSGATDEEFEGITIDGKTYHLPQPQEQTDVVANPSTLPTDVLTSVEIGNTTYSIPQPETPITVIANPTQQGTAELERLQVGDKIYDVPQQTEVVANPSGSGSNNLTKLQVGSAIYNIPQPQTPTTVIANPTGGGDIDLHSIQIGDRKYNIVEPETVAANTLQSGTEILRNLQVGSTVYTILSGGAPIEISTEAAMNAVLEGAQVGAIFKYVGATTALYENGALYMVEEKTATLISFNIASMSYQAEEGMTWGEWVNSDYNTNGWTDDGEYVYNSFGAGVTFVSTNSTLSGRVTPTDEIIDGFSYSTRDVDM